MFRFAVRDLLWLTLVVAVGLGWWLTNNDAEANRQAVIEHAERVRSVLRSAKLQCAQLERDVEFFATNKSDGISYVTQDYRVDWSVLDEPVPGAGHDRQLRK